MEDTRTIRKMANNRLETHAELKWRQAPMGLFKLDEYFAFKYSRKKKMAANSNGAIPAAMGLYKALNRAIQSMNTSQSNIRRRNI